MGSPGCTRNSRKSPTCSVGSNLGPVVLNDATPSESTLSFLKASDGIELTILILADGARPDVLSALAGAGEVPNIGKSFYEAGFGYSGVTVLPSVSNVAYIPMLTGQYPGTANVPGLRWVEKSRFGAGTLFLKGQRSYLGPTHVRLDADMSPGLETLFELNPDSLGVRCDVHRGLSDGNSRFSRIASMPFMFVAHYMRRGRLVDRIVLSQTISWLDRTNDRRPRFVFLPLVDVDKVSHRYGPKHRRTIESYRYLDSLVGLLLDWIRKRGLWDRTHFIITSDHGHTETKQHLDLSALISELGYSVFEHPNVYPRNVDAAVMVSGNSFAHVYLASNGIWEAPLSGVELEADHSLVLRTLRQREEVEWFAYRGSDAALKVVSHDGEATLALDGQRYSYTFDGADPLRLALRHNSVDRSEALMQTIGTDFPDALEQLWYLFESERTGDVVVTAKPGYDLRGWREFPEHRSSHGALCKEHMAVPILSNRPLSVDGGARTVDLFPTVAEGLSLTPTKPHFGRSLL